MSQLDQPQYVTLDITMELNFHEFVVKGTGREFLTNLSRVSGCTLAEMREIKFRSGCVIFSGDLPESAAKKVYELYQLTKGIERENCPEALLPVFDLVGQYKISKVTIREDFEINIVKRQPDMDTDIVFLIHGWRGDKKSFGSLPDHIKNKTGVECLCYEYPTGATGALPDLHFISENFDNWIRNHSISEKRRIYLIAHSMGGIVMRKMLAAQLLRDNPIHEKMNGALLVASPFNGVWLASIAKKVFLLSQDQLKDLSPSSPALVEINSNWETWKRKLPVLARHVRSIYGTKDQVVAPAIAAADDSQPIPILDAGHVNIVKPKSADDEIVRTIIRLLLEAKITCSTGPTTAPMN